jgi:hypothetical protein
MVVSIHDVHPARRTPWVTYALGRYTTGRRHGEGQRP